MNELAKMLVALGLVLIAAGLVLFVLGKVPGAGRLPGDILIRKGNFTFYFPLATCLILSLVVTFFFTFFGKK